MSVKQTALQQYQRLVNQSVKPAASLKLPREGWLRTARKALGLSGGQLAKKIGVTRARVAQAEIAERSGAVTLKTMQAMANALGYRFVYAIVPEKSVEELIEKQAFKKARKLVMTASTHMALENQVLPKQKIEAEIKRLAQKLAEEMPPNFWSER